MTPQHTSRNRITIILHLVVWVLLFILPAYLMYFDSDKDNHILYRNLIQVVFYVLVFYLNYLVFAPRLFFGHHKPYYFASALLTIIVCTVVMEFSSANILPPRRQKHPGLPPPELEHRIPGPGGMMPFNQHKQKPFRGWPIYNFLLTSTLLSAFGLGLRFSDKLTLREKETKEAEKEKLNTELTFLKSQVNPHFFFNTLNNIYSLVAIHPADGQKAILRLSKLMRYMLYETEKGDTSLKMEVEFMKNYLEIVKLRISGKVEVRVLFPEHIPDLTVEPLLLLPFIENAFKYGVSSLKKSFIHIEMSIDGSDVYFHCRNSIAGGEKEVQGYSSGIGLANVSKRLSLLYPERHKLEINRSEDVFDVKLTLNLS